MGRGAAAVTLRNAVRRLELPAVDRLWMTGDA
ncbi:hypothetical protein CF8_3319 [Nocardioides sp. CF8]|nr:hypothetical protein CF8_3319 [Nocardioides sp. CF8]